MMIQIDDNDDVWFSDDNVFTTLVSRLTATMPPDMSVGC